jgi:hypothetical protein
VDRAKPFDIPKREVWEAYKRIKVNQGAAGVDGQTIEDFEVDIGTNLYKLWNRMSSGALQAGCEGPSFISRTAPCSTGTVSRHNKLRNPLSHPLNPSGRGRIGRPPNCTRSLLTGSSGLSGVVGSV